MQHRQFRSSRPVARSAWPADSLPTPGRRPPRSRRQIRLEFEWPAADRAFFRRRPQAGSPSAGLCQIGIHASSTAASGRSAANSACGHQQCRPVSCRGCGDRVRLLASRWFGLRPRLRRIRRNLRRNRVAQQLRQPRCGASARGHGSNPRCRPCPRAPQTECSARRTSPPSGTSKVAIRDLALRARPGWSPWSTARPAA